MRSISLIVSIWCFLTYSELKNAAALPSFAQENDTSLRIINGDQVEAHSVPFMALIILLGSKKTGICGGTLISKKYVLTAGHCTQHNKKMLVLLGVHDVNTREDQVQEIGVEDFSVFEDIMKDDIAILKLESEAKYSPVVKAAKLPSRLSAGKNYAGETSHMYGWGLTENIQPSKVLRKIEMPVATDNDCHDTYNEFSLGKLCTKVIDNKQPFIGDSGGPLVIDGVVVAIARAVVCHFCDKPAIFTRVDKYFDWIENHSDVKIDNYWPD